MASEASIMKIELRLNFFGETNAVWACAVDFDFWLKLNVEGARCTGNVSPRAAGPNAHEASITGTNGMSYILGSRPTSATTIASLVEWGKYVHLR